MLLVKACGEKKGPDVVQEPGSEEGEMSPEGEARRGTRRVGVLKVTRALEVRCLCKREVLVSAFQDY